MTPTLDLSGFNLNWVLTQGMPLIGILLVYATGLWGIQQIKNLGKGGGRSRRVNAGLAVTEDSVYRRRRKSRYRRQASYGYSSSRRYRTF